MGTVYVPIPFGNKNSRVLQWYPVETGDGKHFCPDATGELLVEVSVISQKTYAPPKPGASQGPMGGQGDFGTPA